MEKNYSGISIKRIPALRPLVSLITGIILQYHYHIGTTYIFVFAIASSIILLTSFFLSFKFSFFYKWAISVAVIILFSTVGGILTITHIDTNDKSWIGNYYKQGMPLIITLKEPPLPKQKSYKILAKAEAVLINHQWKNVEGDVLIYIKKGDSIPTLNYGTQLIVIASLNPIEFSGNPGGFNYKEYCSFKHIYYQGFITTKDFQLLKTTKSILLYRIIYNARNNLLSILRKYIHNPTQLSVAEALLIGYRNDLDKELIHAYSNTGVIHIIVIAGLHLGMIYTLLLLLFSPFKNKKWCKTMKPIIIFIILWGFCLITGSNTPILRSTVMFSFILIGELIGKKTNIFNSLALSAFCILLIDPFSLFEAGFQFSYAAVLSIVIFSEYIHRWLFFQNKILRFIWNICAVTISAQILTLPLVIFYFHRIPTLFVVTNILAVPLAGIILYSEIFLVFISPITILAQPIGKGIEGLLWAMNGFITNINGLPFSGWESLQLSIIEVLFLYGFMLGIAIWIFQKNNRYFIAALFSLLVFVLVRCIDFINKERQQQVVVYNIGRYSAIDLVDGRKFQFVGDSLLSKDGFLKDFHLQPARILNRTTEENSLINISFCNNIISSNTKRILLIDNRISFAHPFDTKPFLDAIILKNNAPISIKRLTTLFNCHLYVWDASNTRQKRERWGREADSLSIPCYSVADNGAFIMDL